MIDDGFGGEYWLPDSVDSSGNDYIDNPFIGIDDGGVAGGGDSPYPDAPFDWSSLLTGGKWDLAKLAAKGLTLAGAIQAFQQAQNPPKTGYQGGIPSLTGVRAQTAPAAPNTRPGAGGHRYFSDLQYTNNANAEDPVSGLAAIKTLATNQATDLNAANQWRASQQAAAQPAAQTPAQVKAAQDAFYGRTTPAAPAAQAPLTLATNTPNMTPQQKAMYYNNLIGRGYSDADIRTAAGPQTDENWNALKGLATNPPAAPVAFTPEKQYVPTATAAAKYTPEQPFVQPAKPIRTAAQGGLMGLARGGSTNPRYLQGSTDGMADKIPARIDGQQEAALAHGEFVVPADVVSHLGNGNSDAGADVLYKMMDKIRHARTGTKKQGKQINPEKFTPGGLAYAAGGKVLGFAGPAGSTVPSGVVGTESNLSNWAGPYVTDMLGKGQALSTMPYQAYQGPLSAGDSSLQTQAYGLAGGLQTPAGIGQAATTAGQVATNAGGLNYQPTGATNQFTAPGQYSAAQNTSAFNQPGQYTASQNTNAFATPASTGYTATDTGKTTAASAPNAVGGSYTAANANAFGATAAQSDYNPAAGLQNYQMGPASNVGSQQFTDPGVAASYMNPYLKQSLDPQLQEARRQSQISQQATNAQATQAGAFGGSRSAILGAENQRNLGSNLANITGQGYNTAYTTGQNQFNADQGRSLTAQQANQAAGMNVGSQNLQAKLGVQALGAQYGSQMALANLSNQQQANLQTSAQSQQTALANQQAANQAGQFGAAATNQASLANQQAANQMSQYNAGLGQAANLANQSAANQAAQFGAQQGMTAAQLQAQYGLSAQQANEMSRQFGANYGMQGAQTAAQYGLAAQNANEASRQFGAQYGMTGAQNTAQYGQQAQAQNAQENQFAANYGLQGLNTQLQAAQAQGNLSNMQNQAGLANLNTMAGLGATQQATQQAGIAADQAAFNQERDNPYKMVQYQQSLLQGLPLAAQQYNTSTNPYYAAAGAAGDIGKTLGVGTDEWGNALPKGTAASWNSSTSAAT
jgi:hypothetical protein